jgi:hypothetical protein
VELVTTLVTDTTEALERRNQPLPLPQIPKLNYVRVQNGIHIGGLLGAILNSNHL